MIPEPHDQNSSDQPQPNDYPNEADSADMSSDAVQNVRRTSAGDVGMGVETQADIMSIVSSLNQKNLQVDRKNALVKMREDAVWQKHEKPAYMTKATIFFGGIAVGALAAIVIGGIRSRK